MRKHSLMVMMVLVVIVSLAAIATSADDPFVGTWKLNLSKTKFPSGLPALKSEIVKTELYDNGLRSTFDIVDAQGKASHITADYKCDGKDYKLTGDPSVDTMSCKKPDPNTMDYITKKAGKEVEKGHLVVSKDGKTITNTITITNDKGQEITITAVSDKQ